MASIIKSNTYADFNGREILTANNDGALTVQKSNYPAWRVTLGTGTSLGNGSTVKLDFDTIDVDTNNAYDTTNKRFTVPTGYAGKYFIKAQYAIDLGDRQYASVRFFKNGSNVEFTENLQSISSSTTLTTYMVNSTIMDLAVGDYVEIYARQDSGSTKTANTARSEFCGMRIGS